MANNAEIEFSPTPSIKSLKSRFEQLAIDSTSPTPGASAKPTTTTIPPVQSQTHLAPNSPPSLNSRPRASWTPDDRDRQVTPTIRVVPTESSPDPKVAALKRAPPPPPPSRVKKVAPSPISSPLLRPVPVPPALMSASASSDHEPPRLDQLSSGGDENSEDSSPRLGGVSSLRSRFSAPTPIRASTSSPPHPITPKPSIRPPLAMSRSDSAVMTDNLPPTLPPRHTKPGSVDPASPPIVDSPSEMSTPNIPTLDASPRAGGVAAIRSRFATLDVPTPQISKIYLREDPHTASEPNILSSSPPALPARNLNLRPQSSSLFSRDDSSEFLGSSASSLNSPFSDEESEVSEISEVSLRPVASSRKLNGSAEAIPSSFYANEVYSPRHQRKCSDSSSEGISNLSPPIKPKPPPRPGPPAPPRPPRRSNGAYAHSGHQDSTNSAAATPTPPAPPPLPSRRLTQDEVTPAIVSPTPAPPLPARSLIPHNGSQTSLEPVSPTIDRKPAGNTKLPPPPTRTIGLGDKLPPMRRAPSPSSDESGSEEDPRGRGADALPDSSHSSRRPPRLRTTEYLGLRIQVPAHSGHAILAGAHAVISTPHHIKCFDVSLGRDNHPMWTLDTRDCIRGSVVTSLEFRSAFREEDKGCYLWVGTKDGHLFELEVQTGTMTASKVGIHGGHVTNMFRQGPTMITVDDSGKVLVFDPIANGSGGIGASLTDDVSLVYTSPRVYRIGEKAEFVKLLGGLLWTAARAETNGVAGSSVPVVRIFDIFAPGSVGRQVTPMSHVGAVTSGTILPSHPDHVYLGHEGGCISIWNVATNDGIPVCVEVSKVSTSDVLCLEGVNDRLWAGGRNGSISAYDVSAKPWVVTNCWDAHGGLPVMKISVDPYAIDKLGWLNVTSVGRDEQVKFWDGLLGADRIEQELLKREHSFSTFRDLKVLIVSWNVDAAKPEALGTDPDNIRFLHDVLSSVDSPDIISFGFQELIDLESRKMAAKTVLLGGKKKGEEGKLNEKVTSSYKRWHDRLVQAVKQTMPADCPYTVVHTESLVGLFMCVFVKNTERVALKDAAIATIKRGMGGRYGNKGGIVARFVIDDSSLCFINCHLAAGQHHVRQRNADVAAFLEEKSLFPSDPAEEEVGFVGGGDGSMVLDHEIVFLNGDMNYRIDQRRDVVISAIQSGDLDSLYMHDQLLKEMKHNRGFRLRQFQEGPLTFSPTYKYDRHSSEFDTSEKRRVPAWCDRVLWRSRDPERVALLNYRRYEVNVSDHRPVSAGFRVRVKKVRGDARGKEKKALEGWWMGKQAELLMAAKEFYVQQALL